MPETTVPIAAELLVSHFLDCPICTAFLQDDLDGEPTTIRWRCSRGEFYSRLLTLSYSLDDFVEAATRLDREPA